ncbi:MAG: hypothetical protein OEY23_09945 [Acidimicrobiia bacterium]|nr:hypothetical protein [Acidimicrobiia bacterium]
MKLVVLGCGRVGRAAASALVSAPTVEGVEGVERLWLYDPSRTVAEGAVEVVGGPSRLRTAPDFGDCDAALVAAPAGRFADYLDAARLLDVPVVCTADTVDDVRSILRRAGTAGPGAPAVVAGMTPGLSCLLARHAADQLDRVDEIHVAKAGTGGPACARTHHAALKAWAADWRESDWWQRPGGTGRQLVHFPEPVGPRDCYRAGLPETFVLHRAFPEASRITARVAATRRDRLTSRLPMLRRPHADGGPGGTRVEVWGRRDGESVVLVYAAAGTPSVIAGTVAATALRWRVAGRISPGMVSLAELADTVGFLADLDRAGVRVAVYEGVF